MRFMQVNHPQIQRAGRRRHRRIGRRPRSPLHGPRVHISAIDLALFEGGIAERFLHSKRTVLPADEAALLQTWIDASRTVLEGQALTTWLNGRRRPSPHAFRQLSLTRCRRSQSKSGGKLSDGSFRSVTRTARYGGFLPVNDDMVTAMLDAFSTRELETATIALGPNLRYGDHAGRDPGFGLRKASTRASSARS